MTDRGRFQTTRWSLVLATRERESPAAKDALAELCQAYWFPVYAFIRRSGRSEDASRDLTQGFFARMIEKNDFRQADRSRGRFRTFLLASVQHFLANEYKAAHALKRGGSVPHTPFEVDDGERRYALDVGHDQTPERLYERRWALATLDAAMARVQAEYRGGREQLFTSLQPCLAGDDLVYADLADQLSTTEGALRVAVHRLRRSFKTALRGVVEATVEQPAEVEDELKYLLSVVAS